MTNFYQVFASLLLFGFLYSCSGTQTQQNPQQNAPNTPAPTGTTATVTLGLENLIQQNWAPLKGKKVGLIVNQTSRTASGQFGPELFAKQKEFTLVKLFSPEHGLQGKREAGVTSDTLEHFMGVPVFSLYGTHRKPTAEMLKGLDALVFDIQDIGVRPYTYVSTMILGMEAAAENSVPFYVLDRPNPLSGERIEGNIIEKELLSFVGQVQVPYIHGMTLGEIAKMAIAKGWFKSADKSKLTVIPLKGWTRNMYWPATKLAWTPPSPNIPRPESAVGAAMLGAIGELGILSIGIGTTEPFLRIGSSITAADSIYNAYRAYGPKGVTLVKDTFTATTTSEGTKTYKGVEIKLPTDWSTLGELYPGQFQMLERLMEQKLVRSVFDQRPQNVVLMFNKVTGKADLYDHLKTTKLVADLLVKWRSDASAFRTARAPYLLYK
ncbi:MAG TPA: DUF1343 domain-containing protein [Candidatus Kapabacteria bacterium]|nr:DUF1343 domain-containing protein [Candidatus Kapabacteria bacterium]